MPSFREPGVGRDASVSAEIQIDMTSEDLEST